MINEHKKGFKAKAYPTKTATAAKPRNPVAKNANAAIGGGASGAHKDKKKAVKQGEVKHKKSMSTMAEGAAYDSRLDQLLTSAFKVTGVTEMRDKRDAYQRDYDSSISGFGRPADHRGLGQELAHERNNLAVSINGKLWKVFPGQGAADSQEEYKFVDKMTAWAEKKSFATGKKWTVSLTGAEPTESVEEEWSGKYKKSINCSHPKGFSQKAHCAGKNKNESMTHEMTCPECGMCEAHGNLSEIKKGAKDSNGVTKCWSGYHAAGTKKGAHGSVRNCVPNEGVTEGDQSDSARNRRAAQAHEQNLDAAHKELRSRDAEGEDMSDYRVNPRTYKIEKKGVAEGDYNPEYDDEAGMADNNLETLKRAVDGLDDMINTGDNLPEWCQEKIAVAKSMLVTVWDYMQSEQDVPTNQQ